MSELREKEHSGEFSSSETARDFDYTRKVRPWRRRVTPWSDIVNGQYKGSGTEDDPYVVQWLPDDNENPLNYSAGFKWAMTFLGEL